MQCSVSRSVRRMADDDRTYMLFYDYVDDMLERRSPYRDAHLAHVQSQRDDGRIVMAGPLGDPPTARRSCSAASDRTRSRRSPMTIPTSRRSWSPTGASSSGPPASAGRDSRPAVSSERCRFRRPACAGCAPRARCAAWFARRASRRLTSSIRCSSPTASTGASRSRRCPASTACRSPTPWPRPARRRSSGSRPCCCSGSRPPRTRRAREPGTTRASSSSPPARSRRRTPT